LTNKLIGFGFVCISAFLYFGHYVVTAVYASTITNWGDAYKMKKAIEVIGNTPQSIAVTALLVGIIYIIRGEIREYLNHKEKS
jgi:hypothetical protein